VRKYIELLQTDSGHRSTSKAHFNYHTDFSLVVVVVAVVAAAASATVVVVVVMHH
jgi:hypothetical protein